MSDFEELVEQALAHDFSGWDFSFLDGRVVREGTPWDYGARVSELAARADSLVDLGTGGGEFLSGLSPRPPLTVATEGWMPNVPIARARLAPLGIHLVAYEGPPDNAEQAPGDEGGRLPFRDDTFDVVIDRHESFQATDVARVLRARGTFLTQQVGARDAIELCDALGDVKPQAAPGVAEYVDQLTAAGFDVTAGREAFPAKTYLDIGALLSYVLAIPWAFEGFSVEKHRDHLRAIHGIMRRDGGFTLHEHRLLLEAVKP